MSWSASAVGVGDVMCCEDEWRAKGESCDIGTPNNKKWILIVEKK